MIPVCRTCTRPVRRNEIICRETHLLDDFDRRSQRKNMISTPDPATDAHKTNSGTNGPYRHHLYRQTGWLATLQTPDKATCWMHDCQIEKRFRSYTISKFSGYFDRQSTFYWQLVSKTRAICTISISSLREGYKPMWQSSAVVTMKEADNFVYSVTA